jgi:ABC-type Fe3+-hydroxamate transport system substrate-binding protein
VTATRQLTDDLGTPVQLDDRPARVVSLVPSLTESIAVSLPGRLVGATEWCSHPAELDVARVRGTKNPDVGRIVALAPDLVVCNQEENRELDVRRLREAGVPVWVTRIETLDEAFTSLRRLFTEALGEEVPQWLVRAERQWSLPAPRPQRRGAVVIWRDPWMVVGSPTFTADLVSKVGIVNVIADTDGRYPRIELSELLDRSPEIVLLPDEPYAFSDTDGPECFAPGTAVLVPGRSLTWYGPSLATARAELLALLG